MKQFAALHIKWYTSHPSTHGMLGPGQLFRCRGQGDATSSWSAQAQGFRGEQYPLVRRTNHRQDYSDRVDLPVTVDFEGGYSEDVVPAKNVSRLVDLGVIGITFEDRVVQGDGLYAPNDCSSSRHGQEARCGPLSSMRARILFFGDGHGEKPPRKPLERANSTKRQAHLVSSYRVSRTMA